MYPVSSSRDLRHRVAAIRELSRGTGDARGEQGMPTTVTLVPSAERLMTSLRDIGYELPTAVADLIDNSIAASATVVRVDIGFEGEDSWVRIADNGFGMSPEELDEALRYGTHREYKDTELGKFGLGLKTASLSQCRRLTVATMRQGDSEISIRCWDLNHVEETDQWEILALAESECRPECIVPLRDQPGTVVFWDQLDRVLRYKLPSGRAASNGLAALCREVEDHLAMVFHRFLSGRAKRSLPLAVLVNGNRVEAWDPFAQDEPATRPTQRQVLRFQWQGKTQSITVQPYILPPESQFSSSHAHSRASGPNRWNRQQGFYIYRADRLIQSGGWNYLRTIDEHTKLARVAIDFLPRLDPMFQVNVAKMRVKLPDELRNDLTAIASAACAQAEEVYRKKPPKVKPAGPRARSSKASSGDGTGLPPVGGPADAEPQRYEVAVRVVQVLRRELTGSPRILRSVLSELSGISGDFRRAISSSEVAR
jgi:hypothetical protein